MSHHKHAKATVERLHDLAVALGVTEQAAELSRIISDDEALMLTNPTDKQKAASSVAIAESAVIILKAYVASDVELPAGEGDGFVKAIFSILRINLS